MLPGPSVLALRKEGAVKARMRRKTDRRGADVPSMALHSFVRPRLKPKFSAMHPRPIPMTKPTRPKRALRSPAARRRTMRSGQPRKTRAPIETQAAMMNLMTGDEPLVGRNSPRARATMKAPSTRPGISGLRYWVVALECKPSDPAMSRRKHAMQKPMFPGLPRSTRMKAAAATTAPAENSTSLSL